MANSAACGSYVPPVPRAITWHSRPHHLVALVRDHLTLPRQANVARLTPQAVRLARGRSIRSHHFVVLVFDNMTVPHVLAAGAEGHPDPCDFAGISDDGVLHSVFSRSRKNRSLDRQACLLVEPLPVHDLEKHFMDVYRMSIGREVVELPYLC